MKLEEQVVSLELSKKLKELGVKQDSLFVWMTDTRKQKPHFIKLEGSASTIIMSSYVSKVSAFTVAELAEILAKGKHCFLPSYNSNFDHGWYYKFFDGPTIHEQSLADCLAKMLIYLLENSLLSVN